MTNQMDSMDVRKCHMQHDTYLFFFSSVQQSGTAQFMELNLQIIEDTSLAEEKRDATKNCSDSQSHSKDRVFERLVETEIQAINITVVVLAQASVPQEQWSPKTFFYQSWNSNHHRQVVAKCAGKRCMQAGNIIHFRK